MSCGEGVGGAIAGEWVAVVLGVWWEERKRGFGRTLADANTRIVPARGPVLGLEDVKAQHVVVFNTEDSRREERSRGAEFSRGARRSRIDSATIRP